MESSSMSTSTENQINAEPQKRFTESKKEESLFFFRCFQIQEYETLWKIMYLVVSIFSALLLQKVYMFQTMTEFQNVRRGSFIDILYVSLPFCIIFTVVDVLIHYAFDGLCERYYLADSYQGKAREKRAYTIVKWAYSIIYYAFSSVAAFLLIKDTSFFPTWLGGSGQCTNLMAGAPRFDEATENMKIFYLLQFGKHFSRLFSHMFIKQEGNYYEYILHHALSTFLILFSYLTNQWLVGIMVLFCHDISDFFLIFARAYRDYRNYSRVVLKIFYVFAMTGWIGGRLIIFPACCVYASLKAPYLLKQTLSDQQKYILNLPYTWMGYMLVALLVLQIFWTYYIARAFVSVNVTAKVSNSYQ